MSKNEKRTELAKEIRQRLIPLLEDLGFESTRKDFSVNSDDPKRGNFFRRTRDSYEDEIWIHWDKYGRPRFILEFKTSQAERMEKKNVRLAAKLEYGRVYPSRGPLWRMLLGGEPAWFGSVGSIRRTVDIAQKRARELDAFLKRGAMTTYIKIG